MLKPSDDQARMVTTRISNAIARGMFRPESPARAAAGGAADSRVSLGSTASRSVPTTSVGPSIPSVWAGRKPSPARPATRKIINGGPTAMPTLPPSENHESAVALRSPATLLAVL